MWSPHLVNDQVDIKIYEHIKIYEAQTNLTILTSHTFAKRTIMSCIEVICVNFLWLKITCNVKIICASPSKKITTYWGMVLLIRVVLCCRTLRELTVTVSFSLMHYEFKSPIFFDSVRKKASAPKARDKILRDNKHEGIRFFFLFSSDRAWKTHLLRTDAWRPKGELIHLHLHGLSVKLSHTWPLSTCCLFHFHPSLTLTIIWASINNLQEG